MNQILLYGMTMSDMEYLQRWSGIRFDIAQAIAHAFVRDDGSGFYDFENAMRVARLWQSAGGRFPITDTVKTFPPKPPSKPAETLSDRERICRELDSAAQRRRQRAAEADNERDHAIALAVAHELEFIAAAIRTGAIP